MIPTLVVGGERRFVDDRLTQNLRRHNIKVTDVWTWDKEPGNVPENTKLMFFVTDMMSHRHNDAAKAEALRRNIPIVYGTRKWSVNKDRLVEAGFPEIFDKGIFIDATKVHTFTNPKLTGGYHTANIIALELDREKMYVVMQITDGEDDGAIYSDVLMTRRDWNGDKPLNRMDAFTSCIGISFRLNSIEKFEDAMTQIDKAIGAKTVHFHYNPTGNSPVTYMTRSAWLIASAHRRKKKAKVEREKQEAEVAALFDTIPTPTIEEPPMPAAPLSVPSAKQTTAELFNIIGTPVNVSRTASIIETLVGDPTLTCADLAERLNLPPTGTIVGNFRNARILLGIQTRSPSIVHIDRSRYENACRLLGVTPVPGTVLERPIKRAEAPPTLEAAVPAAPVEVAPPEVNEQKAAKTGGFNELKEIIAMLRDEMAKHDIRRMVISPDDVSFTRVVVVEDKLEM